MRGHVAGAAGIAVVAPRAADVVGPLEDDEVLDAGLAQAMAIPSPAKPLPTIATRTSC
jgi:hypothetical protein